jgi:mannose-1-phosphate guanylyltransferase
MAGSGIKEVILACGTGYNSKPLVEAIGDGSDIGLSIEYSFEETALGTVGAIKNVKDKLDEVFVAANGDVFADISLKSQIKTHFSTNADLTIALTKVKDEDRPKFGIAILEDDGKIIEFKEKPGVHETNANLANAGVYVMNKDLLSMVTKYPYDLSKDLVPKLLKKDARVQGFMLKGTWRDVGRPSDLLGANLYMAKKLHSNTEWKASRIKDSAIKGPFYLGDKAKVTGSKVSSAVVLQNSVVKDSVLTKAMIMRDCNVVSAKIRNSIIGTGCTICSGAVIIDSDIEDGTTVGKGEKISGIRVNKE